MMRSDWTMVLLRFRDNLLTFVNLNLHIRLHIDANLVPWRTGESPRPGWRTKASLLAKPRPSCCSTPCDVARMNAVRDRQTVPVVE
jgi:hypothetical protein